MTRDTARLPSPEPGRFTRTRATLARAWEDRGRIGCGLVIVAIGYLVLRGCVPALGGKRLPAVLETAVTEAYEHCDQDFPIWPGEVRMPTCDLVTIRAAGAGTVPSGSRAGVITRALCYHVDTEKLFWGEVGQWKHEIAWALRTFSKVAVLQDGGWILYPDEDNDDRARWIEFECPGEYEASSGMVPRRS
jgi:hypothetical protein